MRLSTVFELLLIFLLIAFAAYGRVIDRDEATIRRAVRSANESRQMMGVEVMSLKQATENVNKYCICNANICNCCRNFNIPIVQLKGPGCASLQYLEDDKLAVQLSMGENILTSTVVNGQKPKAVCFPMPGGLTKFCGRIYSIQREPDNHFKACLGLELQSSTELEAALRVSCFRFGPDGVKLRPAEELPVVEAVTPADEDDDDDLFGLDDDDDDDDDDDEEEDAPEGNAVPGSSATNDETEDDEDDDDDLLGFGALLDILTGDDDSDKKKKPQVTTSAPILPFTIPMLTKSTGASPILENSVNSATIPSVKPVTASPVENSQSQTSQDNAVPSEESSSNSDKLEGSPTIASDVTAIEDELMTPTESVTEETSISVSASDSSAGSEQAGSNNVEYVVTPDKPVALKKVSTVSKNKPSLNSGSINAIKNDIKKPSSVIVTIPPKPNPAPIQVVQQHNEPEEDDDDDDDDDILGTSDLDDEDDDDDEEDEKFELEEETDDDKDEDEEETVDDEKVESAEDNDKVEGQHEEDDVSDLIDDDDDEEEEEEEEAVLSALVEDEKEDPKPTDKVADNEAANPEEDDNDYGMGLAELLARKRHMRSGRRSKVMRL